MWSLDLGWRGSRRMGCDGVVVGVELETFRDG